MNKNGFRLKAIIGLVCVVVFILPVLWRQHAVRMKRGQAIVSTISEWEKFGKPVLVQKIAHKDMKVYTKVTIMPLSKTLFAGYVTKGVQAKLKNGQSVSVGAEGGRVLGSIRYVGQALNVDTGMFQVRVAFDHGFEPLQHIVVGYVHTSTIKNVISAPNEIFDAKEGKPFIWTIRDGYAYRQPVVLGARNGYNTVVLDGLHDGDMVVVAGQTQLSDKNKDRVQIVGYREVMGDGQ